MLILGRDRLKDPGRGYAKTFLRAAGGVPRARPRAGRADRRQRRRPEPGRARRRRTGAGRRLGLPAAVAHVEGDDLLRGPASWDSATADRQRLPGRPRHRRVPARRRRRRRHRPGHRRRAGRRPRRSPTSAGAATTWDALAGAVVAGHVLECGAQATGGNYAFFDEHRSSAAAPRLPARRDRTPTARPSSPSTPAPAARRPSARSPRSCSTRSAARVRRARRHRPLRHRPAERGRRPTGCGSRAYAASRRRRRSRSALNRLGGFRNEVTFVLTGSTSRPRPRSCGASSRPRCPARPAE